MALEIGVGELVDPAVGLADAIGEPLLRASRVGQPLLEGLHREPRGDLAGLRAAHAVGDDEHRGADVHRVLVVPALASGVGHLDGFGGANHRLLLV